MTVYICSILPYCSYDRVHLLLAEVGVQAFLQDPALYLVNIILQLKLKKKMHTKTIRALTLNETHKLNIKYNISS